MQCKMLDKKIDYDGSQLKSHWIFDQTGEIGDAMVAFVGKCNVKPEHMIDLVDKKNKCKIYSEEMLHFIIEHFDTDIEKMVMRQRLFAAIVAEEISKESSFVERKGNDIYDGDAKVNVSIATASVVSGLIHFGINVSSRNTPVKTKSLNDFKIQPKVFAAIVMKRYAEEIEGIKISRCKVRSAD